MINIIQVLCASLAVASAASVRDGKSGQHDNAFRDWTTAAKLAQQFCEKLTIEEKISMVTGNSSAGLCIGNIAPIPRLNFPGICMIDGPNGVNRADGVSVFPSGLSAAATWDRALIYQRGFALGTEAKGKGANVLLGPSTNPMGRHALGGRNWEGFGSDPYLAGVAMTETLQGMHDAGVQSCSKHYIANEQETQRSNTTEADGTAVEAISSNVDDRTMHELYLWPFANAVKAGTSSVMCSYNRVNQTYACENSDLLKKYLRKELGFEGYVVSDWYATHSTAKSVNAGTDMEMPGYTGGAAGGVHYFGKQLYEAYRRGSVSEARLDAMVKYIMTPYYVLSQDHKDYPRPDPNFKYVTILQELGLATVKEMGLIPEDFAFPRGRNVRGDHARIIREIGAAQTVLLKNVNETLPLQKPKFIAVFGNDAGDVTNGFYRPSNIPKNPDTGTLIIGGGSGAGRAPYIVSPLQAIRSKAEKLGSDLVYITNNEMLAQGDFRSVYPVPDICLVFQQTFASESWDRTSFELDGNSTAVINHVANFCTKTVVITHSAGVNTMPWADHPKIAAILAAHYPGQETGNAIVDVLWGDVAPSGRLPYTIPKNGSDAGPPIVNLTKPVSDPLHWQADFTEGQLIDYRHYDAKGIEPLYEFGFGLTYTNFTFKSSLSVALTGKNKVLSATPNKSHPIGPGGHPDLWENVVIVKISVTNTGKRSGHAIPQLYLSFPKSTPDGTPEKVLRGFQKVYIKAGASAVVEFKLTRRDVSYWDTMRQLWVIPKGKFVFSVSSSSRSLLVKKEFTLL